MQINITFPGSPPLFTFPSICVGSIPPNLPTVSDDGVNGSWSPSVISTATAGIKNYIFTPSSGECRQIKIQAIVVDDKVTPLFDQIEPLCYNSVPVVLPIAANNGISGIWNPSVVSTNLPGKYTFTFIPDPTFCAEKYFNGNRNISGNKIDNKC
jgi:hypothetical protein